MTVRRIALIVTFFILVTARSAHAQGKRPTAFTISYPVAAGVLWNVTDRLALWPELTLLQHQSDNSGAHLNTAGGALHALLYLRAPDAFHPYVAPRFAYSRTHSTSSGAPPAAAESTVSSYSTSGSFGAQYMLGVRLGAFAEFGLEYTRQDGTSSLTNTRHVNITGTRSALGAILYF